MTRNSSIELGLFGQWNLPLALENMVSCIKWVGLSFLGTKNKSMFILDITFCLFQGPTTGYVCTHCYLQVEKDFRKYQRMRTCMYTLEEPEEEQRNHEIDIPDKSPKIPKKVFSSPATPKSHKRGRKRKRVTKTKKQERHLSEQSKFFPICNALMHSNYYSALRSIFRSCPSSKRAFADIVRTEVVREMRAFAKVDNPSAGSITGIESIKKFSWMDLIGQAAKKMPIFHAAVCGAMGMKKSTEHNRKGR